MEEIVCEGDIVAVRVSFSGTQQQTFVGVEPTYKRIGWEAMEFFKVESGVIPESWGAWPIFDMMKMLKSETYDNGADH